MVYVDDMNKPYGRLKLSHMIADTTKELLTMAEKIGVNTKWLQKAGTHKEHMDICLTKKKLAIEYGAKEITKMQLGRMVASRRS